MPTAPLTIGVVSYGSDPRYARMLEVWMEHYRRSGCELPVEVLTDEGLAMPKDIVRPGCPFDVQGVIICEAVKRLGRCLIVDSDALFMRDPTELLLALPFGMVMGMGDDAGGRRLRDGKPEMNGGVLYFGDPALCGAAMGDCVANLYAKAFGVEVRAKNTSPTLEQVAWSHVWHYWDGVGLGVKLPRTLNWSRMWPANPDAHIFHDHGSGKWGKY